MAFDLGPCWPPQLLLARARVVTALGLLAARYFFFTALLSDLLAKTLLQFIEPNTTAAQSAPLPK